MKAPVVPRDSTSAWADGVPEAAGALSIGGTRVEALKGLPTLISDAITIRDRFTDPAEEVSGVLTKGLVRRILAQSP